MVQLAQQVDPIGQPQPGYRIGDPPTTRPEDSYGQLRVLTAQQTQRRPQYASSVDRRGRQRAAEERLGARADVLESRRDVAWAEVAQERREDIHLLQGHPHLKQRIGDGVAHRDDPGGRGQRGPRDSLPKRDAREVAREQPRVQGDHHARAEVRDSAGSAHHHPRHRVVAAGVDVEEVAASRELSQAGQERRPRRGAGGVDHLHVGAELLELARQGCHVNEMPPCGGGTSPTSATFMTAARGR